MKAKDNKQNKQLHELSDEDFKQVNGGTITEKYRSKRMAVIAAGDDQAAGIGGGYISSINHHIDSLTVLKD